MKLAIFFKESKNYSFYTEIEIKKFILEVQENFKLILKNKYLILNDNDKYYSFFAIFDKLEIYFHYWERVGTGYVELLGDLDLFKVWDLLKEKIQPKYWNVTLYED